MGERPATDFQQKYMERIDSAYRFGQLPDLIRNIQLAEINVKKGVYFLNCPIIQRIGKKLQAGEKPTRSEKFVLAKEVERVFSKPPEISNHTSYFHPLVAFEE